MKPSLKGNGAHTIPTVNKALELVRVLSASNDETTTKALAIQLGLPRSTCYRILRSLIAHDWVRPVAGGRHELSLGLLPLLTPLRQIEALADAVEPVLESLALRTQMTAKASVRQGDYAVTVARCESPQETSVAVRIGASFHLTLGSSGAVLSSELDREEVDELVERAPEECWEHQGREAVFQRLRELNTKGWCCDLGTFRPSCHALSAPIRGEQARVVAALTVIGFPHELSKPRLPELARAVLEAARQAESALKRLPRPQTTAIRRAGVASRKPQARQPGPTQNRTKSTSAATGRRQRT